MIEFNPDCTTITTDPRIVCKEPKAKSRMYFDNPSRAEVIVVEVDGCQLLQKDGRKCDYLLIAFDKEHFVELKGSDLKGAMDQLRASIAILSQDPRKRKKFAFVKCTKVGISETIRQNWKEEFRREYNATLKIKSSDLEHTLE